MCTAVEEEVAPKVWDLSNPEVATFAVFVGSMYAAAANWARNDKKLEAKIAAFKAEKAAAHAEAHPVVEAVAAPAAEAPAVSAVVAVVAAPASGSSTVTDWKVADVVAWLDVIELGVHADTFKAHAVDGKMLLLLEEQELYQVLNIVSPLHRKKIMMGVAELRSAYMSP